MSLSEKLRSLFCEEGARLWWVRLRHIWSFKQSRKSTTNGRALLWYYQFLLFAAHDAEWHKKDASDLVFYDFSCMWRLARDASVVLAQRHPWHQSAMGPVVSSEQTVWDWCTEISNGGIFYKGLWGGYPVLHLFFFSTAPLAPSSHFHTLSSSL